VLSLSPGNALGIGVYRYIVTLTTAYGETTGGPEVAISVTSGMQSVSLTGIPLGPTGTTGTATGRRIYRTPLNGATGSEKLVATLPDNATSAYADALPDSQLSSPLAASNTARIAPPGAPTVAIGATGSLNGTYRYAVTFVSNGGETTGGSEAVIAAANNSVQLSDIPLGPTGTVARKMYRTPVGGASGAEKLLTYVGDNSTTTYTDNANDPSLGVAIPINNTAVVSGSQLPAATPTPPAAVPVAPLTVVPTPVPLLPAPGAFNTMLSAGSQLGVGTYIYALTLVTATGETTLGTEVTITVTSGLQTVNLSGIPLGPVGTTGRNIYRTAVNGAPGSERLLATLSNNTTSNNTTTNPGALPNTQVMPTTYSDAVLDTQLGSLPPTINTAGVPAPGAISLGPLGPAPLNGAYRYAITFVGGAGETTGGAESTIAVANTGVQLANIPIGPPGTVERKIYRTPASGAPGSERLVDTLSDNTSAVYTDTRADSSLGDPIPTANTATAPTTSQGLLGGLASGTANNGPPGALLIALLVVVAFGGGIYVYWRSQRHSA
jgi:hypothetical protein